MNYLKGYRALGFLALLLALGMAILFPRKHRDEVEVNSGTHSSRATDSAAAAGHVSGMDIPSELGVLNRVTPKANRRLVETKNADANLPSFGDTAILTKAGLIAPPTKLAKEKPKQRVADAAPLVSLKSTDWKGNSDALVNALRARGGLSIDHIAIMNLLLGKELFGWQEIDRDWIGDELMTFLRHDEPERAFATLKSIQESPSAPPAMRDYSIQHISRLVIDKIIAREGSEYIWQTFRKNDAITTSTALISLHRVSEQTPNLVSPDAVIHEAMQLLSSGDERLQVTAQAIVKDTQKH